MKIVNNRVGRLAVLATASALGLGALATAPASAETVSHPSGATATAADVVSVGQSLRIEGTGFTAPADGGGSVIAVKFDRGDLSPEGGVVNPSNDLMMEDVWAAVQAEADGSFSVDLPFPTVANSSAADVAADEAGIGDGWAAGETHVINLLTGSLRAGGDTPRSIQLTFTTTDSPVVVTASNGGRGADPAQVTIAATANAGSFGADEAVTATVDGEETAWTSGGTAGADGALGRSTLVYAPGALRAGAHEVTLTGAGGASFTSVVETTPTVAFSSLTLASSGALSVANLPEGSSIASIEFGDVAFSGLPLAAEDNSGKATVPYTIPADAALGTQDVVLTLTDPDATYTSSAKVSPSSEPENTDAFDIVATEAGDIAQGLYQSAYSAAEDALFATTAYQTSATETDPTQGWDGTLYKLDPDTLEVLDTARPEFVEGDAGARFAPYGIAVDDEHGNVWVTNTRQNTIAVYDAETLDVVQQFEAGTVNHTRDIAIDPVTNKAFVTAAARGGATEDGLIAVFDTETLEELDDVTVTTESGTQFVPMSLDIDTEGGHLYTVNLSAPEAVEIDTATGESRVIALPEGSSASASGVAYDEATGHLFVASQGTDNVLVVDAATGELVANTPTGSGALNVEFDNRYGFAYVANFSGGQTISVVDAEGDSLASLPIASTNHVSGDDNGTIYAVTKADGNQIVKITPKALVSAKPVVKGTPKVGKKLRVVTGTWSNDAELRIQWLANGKVIKGAKAKTLKLGKATKGKRISVRVTGENALFAKTTVSKATAKVAPAKKAKKKNKKKRR